MQSKTVAQPRPKLSEVSEAGKKHSERAYNSQKKNNSSSVSKLQSNKGDNYLQASASRASNNKLLKIALRTGAG